MLICLYLTKTLAHEFHYKYVKEKYDGKDKYLFTDADRLTSDIEMNDVHADFCANKVISDFSEYSEISKLYDEMNKNVIGNQNV